jgi:sugar O-acyltransferase (sialic acid O-acetyltransferase NeuD family)
MPDRATTKTGSVVIFGAGNFASLAWYCMSNDSPWRVEAFTVDRAFVGNGTHQGLPVIPFDELHKDYPPAQIDMLIPLGYQRINGLRRERFNQARERGYRFANYISSNAVVWPGLVLGENCMVHDHAVIEPSARLGDNVIVRNGAHISHHVRIGSHSFIASQASVGHRCHLGEQVFVGKGAVIRDSIAVAERTYIGAGSVLLEPSQSGRVYVGDPARQVEGATSMLVTGGS